MTHRPETTLDLLLRALRSSWRTLVFGVGACVLIWGLVAFFIAPASDGWMQATPEQRKAIRAYSSLLLVIILVILLLGVLWALRRRD
jgi:hypothetical protein